MQVVNQDKTNCEMTFIKRLGRWSEIETDRRSLLENYIIATSFREKWDGIDSARVRAYAALCLNLIGD